MNNKKTTLIVVISVFLTLGFSISIQSLFASWSGPTATPPVNNASLPLNVSNVGQTKYSGLIINGGGTNANGLLVDGGRTGVNTLSPAVILDVNGEIRPGNTNIVCNTTVEGAMRYNRATKNIEYCDGVSWGEFVAVDRDPLPFSFLNLTNQNLLATVTSDIITPTNYQRSIVSITGSGTPEISCNGGAWLTSCLLYDGQKLQARLTTENANSVTSSALISMGSVSTQWQVTTKSRVTCEYTSTSPGTSMGYHAGGGGGCWITWRDVSLYYADRGGCPVINSGGYSYTFGAYATSIGNWQVYQVCQTPL